MLIIPPSKFKSNFFFTLITKKEMWDRKTFKKVSSINASNTSYCEWSPDGRHLMTAILYKRLKVDNGVSIWHYQGVLTHKIDVKEMYEVSGVEFGSTSTSVSSQNKPFFFIYIPVFLGQLETTSSLAFP